MSHRVLNFGDGSEGDQRDVRVVLSPWSSVASRCARFLDARSGTALDLLSQLSQRLRFVLPHFDRVVQVLKGCCGRRSL